MTKVVAISLPEEALTHPTRSLLSVHSQFVEQRLAQGPKAQR
jgi:hypothetical protein